MTEGQVVCYYLINCIVLHHHPLTALSTFKARPSWPVRAETAILTVPTPMIQPYCTVRTSKAVLLLLAETRKRRGRKDYQNDI